MMAVPDRTEAAEYFFTYIDQVVGTDICRTLDEQLVATAAFLEGISEEQSLTRYAPGEVEQERGSQSCQRYRARLRVSHHVLRPWAERSAARLRRRYRC